LASDLHLQGIIYNSLGRAAQAETEVEAHHQAAIKRFQESLAIKRRIGNEAGTADSLAELGKLLQDAGQMGEAVAAFNEALDVYQRAC
jgi:Flp pilus assembly protein TadD